MTTKAKTFLIEFTEAELETIGSAMDDYRCYADDEASENDLIGGIPVADRVDSIEDKIDKAFRSLYPEYQS